MNAPRLALLAGLTLSAPLWAADTTDSERTDAEHTGPLPELQRIPRTDRDCLERAAATAADDTPARALRDWCNPPGSTGSYTPAHDALRSRLALEERTQFNPFVLTPHRRNYLMPFSNWTNRSWKDPARDPDSLQPHEVKFQVSLKTPLVDDALGDNYTLYGAFTMTSWWQAYNEDVSRPFRESNYAPSVFLSRPLGGGAGRVESEMLSAGFVHESNGQPEPTSRGWNRIFASYVFRTGSYYWHFKPWYRIPEEKKDFPLDPDGDSNPDITDYMGNFELTLSRPFNNHVVDLMVRHNLDQHEDRGAAQLDYSFPVNERFKGIFQVFTGYGDSLIHYNEYVTRVSVGILLTDML